MGTISLFKSQNQMRHCHPYFLFHIDFHMVLAFIHGKLQNTSFTKIWYQLKECVMVWYWNCDLVVLMVSDTWWISLCFSWNSNHPMVPLWLCCGAWGHLRTKSLDSPKPLWQRGHQQHLSPVPEDATSCCKVRPQRTLLFWAPKMGYLHTTLWQSLNLPCNHWRQDMST